MNYLKLLFCLILSLLTVTIHAQKVEIEGEDVIVNGSAWCKIYKPKGILESNFTLATPAGKKFLLLKYAEGACNATWLGKGTSYPVESNACLPKYLVKQLYNLDILEDGDLSESALQDFFASSGASAASSLGEEEDEEEEEEEGAVMGSSNTGGSIGYNMVDRDRNKIVQIFGETIRQDFTDIGNISKKTSYTNGQSNTEYTISLPDGQLVATAKFIGMNSLRAEIITAKDNKRHSISCTSSINREKEVAQYLIRLLYL